MALFKIEKFADEGKARAGFIEINGISVPTPVFMPVGTAGTVKAMLHKNIIEIGYRLILCNTYHLFLRPGIDVIRDFGGVHKFISWEGGILTDSGGYQIFSLKELRKVKEDGYEFRSHIDGSLHFLTPEKIIDIQMIFGSNIMMVLDECVEYPADYLTVKKSVELTLNWASRSKKHFEKSTPLYKHFQHLFGIVQGGTFPELRKECISKLLEMNFDGYAIGGLSVGEPEEEMYKITDVCTEHLPKDKPRYLMGVGNPINILQAIDLGIDMFDCVLPTRNARNGQIFTTRGKINVRNAKYKFSKEPIDPNLNNEISQNFTLGYLRHLFISKEISAYQIATYQNLSFYFWLLKTAREKILDGSYRLWKNELILNFKNV